MKKTPEFNVEAGLVLQAKHLLEWKDRLTPHAYNLLVIATAAKTAKHTLRDGYDVPRGTDIDFLAKTIKISQEQLTRIEKARIEKARIEKARIDLKGKTLDELCEEITVQLIDANEVEDPIHKALDGWHGVSNQEGLIAFFGTEEEAFRYRLDFINRILNG